MLRARTLYSARSVQIGATLAGTIPAEVAVLGFLPVGFRPSTLRRHILTITSGRYNAQGDLSITFAGVLVLWPRSPLSDASFRLVYPIE